MPNKKTPKPKPVPAIPKVPPILNWTPQVKYTILLLLGFFFYVNTLQNEYALDDDGVILANQYVQQGFGGIKNIMTSDAFASYLQKMGAGQHLNGGRYRPLSIVIFAIQQSIFGNSPFVRHLFNVLCFLATIFAMFYFLSRYMLKHLPYGEDMAFVATVLFIIHPIHTEVVANIKSLDEILSLLFILCTLISGLKYKEKGKIKYLVLAMFSYLLALLSKEYGIIMMALIPLFFYLYPGQKKKNAIEQSFPYYAVVVIYLLMRFSAVGIPHGSGNEKLLNNQLRVDPFYYATFAQKFATECYCLGKYVAMLFFPYPLSSDYSYSQIPYHNFSDISVWASMLLYIAITIWGIQLFRKKNMMSFAVFFFLFSLVPVSNFFINVGAMFGERFAYHASFGFVILVSYWLFYVLRKFPLQVKKTLLIGLMSVLGVLCGAEVVTRNTDWKDNDTLFTTDISTVPNSAFMNCNAAVIYINMAQRPENSKRGKNLLDSAVACLYKAIRIDKTFPDPYINLGLAYYCLNQQDSAKHYWDWVLANLYTNHPPPPELQRFMPMLAKAYLDKGLAYGKAGNTAEAISDMKKGISEDPENAEIWYNLGGAYYTEHQYDSARGAWTKAVQLKPGYTEAQNGLNALNQAKQ